MLYYWVKVLILGSYLVVRDSYLMFFWNNKFIIFGGEDLLNLFLLDIYILDMGEYF